MDKAELDRLRGIAKAATPGPWTSVLRKVHAADNHHDKCVTRTSADYDVKHESTQMCANARHIAAFDPPTALALIDEIERLRSAQDVERRIVEARIAGIEEGAALAVDNAWLVDGGHRISWDGVRNAVAERISELRDSLERKDGP